VIPLYPLLSVVAAAAVVLLELLWLRTGLFRDRSYWAAMLIVFVFMIPIDGWMSKTSDPIVIYDPDVLSGIRFPWDIPLEEFVYAFAVTLTMLLGRVDGAQRGWRRASAEPDEREAARHDRISPPQ
jgi:lycopene cyclase domain-containing protein